MTSPPAPADHYDALVLGAGISGLVAASVLLDQGARRVAVVDEYPRVGGNHIDRSYGPYTFDIGSLVFQDDSPLVRHFPELLGRYVPADPSWGRLNPQGKVTAYPLSGRDDLAAAGPVALARMGLSAAWGRVSRRRLRTARDFAEHWLGRYFVHRSGLGSYMERFCGLPPQEVDVRFAEQRMEWIARYAHVGVLVDRVRRAVVRQGEDEQPNHQLVRPREGFAHLYAPVADSLEARGVTFHLGRPLQDLRRQGESHSLEVGGTRLVADRVISTVPLDHALRLCGAPASDPLPTVTLISLFFSFRGRRGFDPSVFYNFSHEGAWKRITVHSDFYGPEAGREYFTAEVIGGRVGGSVVEAERDFRRHVAANHLFEGDLRLEGSHVLPHAYPVYTRGSGGRAESATAALRRLGIESLGRQGGFQYQPTARVSTEEVEQKLGGGGPATGRPGGHPA